MDEKRQSSKKITEIRKNKRMLGKYEKRVTLSGFNDHEVKKLDFGGKFIHSFFRA